VGSLTLTRILTDTTTLYSAVALSVRANNPARRPHVWQRFELESLVSPDFSFYAAPWFWQRWFGLCGGA
jgi:hypothetical protein